MPAFTVRFADGAAVFDPALISEVEVRELLDANTGDCGRHIPGTAGRNGVRLIERGGRQWVWRHNCRGGWCARISRDADSVRGLTDEALFDASTAAGIRALDREAIERGEPVASRSPSHDASGEVHTFSSVRAPYRDASGKIVGVIGVARDVTEVERAGAALAASEKRHRDLFEMSKGLICMHELDGRLITVNPAAANASSSSLRDARWPVATSDWTRRRYQLLGSGSWSRVAGAAPASSASASDARSRARRRWS